MNPFSNHAIAVEIRPRSQRADPRPLGRLAAWALREEALLTPKPGLVDRRGNGAHADMNLAMLLHSADVLEPWFARIATCAATMPVGTAMRTRLGTIGRAAEAAMFAATGGVNTHRGAIWALGLLVAGCTLAARRSVEYSPGDSNSIEYGSVDFDTPAFADEICRHAARLARMPVIAQVSDSHGSRMHARFGVEGARGEAQNGFPHVRTIALPALREARTRYGDEQSARLHALLTLVAHLDDTCLLYRGGAEALAFAQDGAIYVLDHGLDNGRGRRALCEFDRGLIDRNASPGGSADLLAATLLLDRIENTPEIADGNV